MKVRKAIIPAAGMGTRVLPASKAVPKEMLNIVDKPAIQYIVEEAFASGIEEVLIITNRNKGAIEDHFDHSFELEAKLSESEGKQSILDDVLACSNFGNIYFLRQKETKGLGHAVLCAKNFIGNEPFAVLYGDDVIISEKPVTKQLCDAYEKYGKGIVGVKEVSDENITKYCSLKTEHLENNCYNCVDMIEKPKPEEIMGNFSILGRTVLPPEIFDILEKTPAGAGNELQLTDAMKVLAQTEGMIAVDYEGKRYDMGNKFGILEANIEVGLNHPDTKDALKSYIKKIAESLNESAF
ncbi:MAG: UTP--glucose-1-phosphate uridylyltransferase GalU [Eubacterium sp.]|nr:UTP--glucose-1-phosphate uridylyltransferase GalU [Eubacterium sp.]